MGRGGNGDILTKKWGVRMVVFFYRGDALFFYGIKYVRSLWFAIILEYRLKYIG